MRDPNSIACWKKEKKKKGETQKHTTQFNWPLEGNVKKENFSTSSVFEMENNKQKKLYVCFVDDDDDDDDDVLPSQLYERSRTYRLNLLTAPVQL